MTTNKFFLLLSYVFFTGSVDLSLVSFNWFLTVFVDNFPVQVCCFSFVHEDTTPLGKIEAIETNNLI